MFTSQSRANHFNICPRFTANLVFFGNTIFDKTYRFIAMVRLLIIIKNTKAYFISTIYFIRIFEPDV